MLMASIARLHPNAPLMQHLTKQRDDLHKLEGLIGLYAVRPWVNFAKVQADAYEKILSQARRQLDSQLAKWLRARIREPTPWAWFVNIPYRDALCFLQNDEPLIGSVMDIPQLIADERKSKTAKLMAKLEEESRAREEDETLRRQELEREERRRLAKTLGVSDKIIEKLEQL